MDDDAKKIEKLLISVMDLPDSQNGVIERILNGIKAKGKDAEPYPSFQGAEKVAFVVSQNFLHPERTSLDWICIFWQVQNGSIAFDQSNLSKVVYKDIKENNSERISWSKRN